MVELLMVSEEMAVPPVGNSRHQRIIQRHASALLDGVIHGILSKPNVKKPLFLPLLA